MNSVACESAPAARSRATRSADVPSAWAAESRNETRSATVMRYPNVTADNATVGDSRTSSRSAGSRFIWSSMRANRACVIAGPANTSERRCEYSATAESVAVAVLW